MAERRRHKAAAAAPASLPEAKDKENLPRVQADLGVMDVLQGRAVMTRRDAKESPALFQFILLAILMMMFSYALDCRQSLLLSPAILAIRLCSSLPQAGK